MAGVFITLEGGEAVGKSTLIRSLRDWLVASRIDVVTTREPGGTPLADAVRSIFKSPPEGTQMSGLTEAFLVSAARSDHVTQVIHPALKQGQWVLCDRFTDSTRVYQGLWGGVPFDQLESMINLSTGPLKIDLTLLLDCDPAVTMKRMQRATSEISKSDSSRDDSVRFDGASLSVHQRLRDGYRRIAGFYPHRFYIIDASKTPEEIFSQAKAAISERFAGVLLG